MMKMKLLSAGALSLAMLATPAMAQVIIQEPGVIGYSYVDTPYWGGYGYRPGIYHGARFYRAPRVGAFATAPWDDGFYSYSYGYVAPY